MLFHVLFILGNLLLIFLNHWVKSVVIPEDNPVVPENGPVAGTRLSEVDWGGGGGWPPAWT